MEEINLIEMWGVGILFTGMLIMIYLLLSNVFELGFRALRTWSPDAVGKLHDEHGKTKAIVSTLLFGFFTAACMLVAARWILVIWLTVIVLLG